MNTVEDKTDILIVGGGTAGTVAAIQAGRAGIRTMLVESAGQLGGTMTNGGVSCAGYFFSYGRQVIAGIGWELIVKTMDLDGSPMPDFDNPPMVHDGFTPPEGRASHYVSYNRYLLAAVAEEAVLNAGVTVRYHEIAVEAEEDGDGWRVTAVGKGVRRVIHAKELIDCTGDAAVVDMLGFERERGEVCQPGTLEFCLKGYDPDSLDADLIQERYKQALTDGALKPADYAGMNDKRFIYFLRQRGRNEQHIPGADSLTSESQTRANIEGRRSLLRLLRFVRTLPGCENTQLDRACGETAIRETFRIVGETRVTKDDYLSGRVFDDAVGHSLLFVDLHTDDGGKKEFPPKDVVPTIPFSALIPRGSRRLLAAGRCISSDRLANSALRVQPSCFVMGQAAGGAAALGVQSGVPSRDVPIDALRELLRQHEAIVPEPGGQGVS